jgi:hypothetical protein
MNELIIISNYSLLEVNQSGVSCIGSVWIPMDHQIKSEPVHYKPQETGFEHFLTRVTDPAHPIG